MLQPPYIPRSPQAQLSNHVSPTRRAHLAPCAVILSDQGSCSCQQPKPAPKRLSLIIFTADLLKSPFPALSVCRSAGFSLRGAESRMIMNVNDGPSFIRPQPMKNVFEISSSLLFSLLRSEGCACPALSLQEVTVIVEMGGEEVIGSGILVKPLSLWK